MRAPCSTALAALIVFAHALPAHAEIYQDPTGAGTTMGGVAGIPLDSSDVVLNVFWDAGDVVSVMGVCESGGGNESCGGSIEIRSDCDNMTVIEGTGGLDVVLNQIDNTRAKLNWLDALTPDTAAKALAIVTVNTTVPCSVEIDGMNVAADGSGETIPTTLVASSSLGDADGDGVLDGDDNCPQVPNGAGEALGAPTWGDQAESLQFPGVGCACVCGDPNRDCIVNVIDATIAQTAGLPTQPPHPAPPDNPPLPPSITFFDRAFCDINADGACNLVDSPITATIGLPTQPVGGPFNNPPPPGGAVVDPTGCCGYLGLDFGCGP